MSEAAFWDRLAPRYFRQPIADPTAYEQTLERVRAHLRQSDRVLELGAGTGGTALRLAPHVAHWTASDYSRQMIEHARERLVREGAPVNIDLRVASADEPAPGAPYDAVCAFNLLHLVPDLDASVGHMRAALRPGGLAISKTPCLAEQTVLLRAVLPLMRAVGQAPRVLFFDSKQLEAAFVRAGFTLVESCTFGKARATRFLVARA